MVERVRFSETHSKIDERLTIFKNDFVPFSSGGKKTPLRAYIITFIEKKENIGGHVITTDVEPSEGEASKAEKRRLLGGATPG